MAVVEDIESFKSRLRRELTDYLNSDKQFDKIKFEIKFLRGMKLAAHFEIVFSGKQTNDNHFCAELTYAVQTIIPKTGDYKNDNNSCSLLSIVPIIKSEEDINYWYELHPKIEDIKLFIDQR